MRRSVSLFLTLVVASVQAHELTEGVGTQTTFFFKEDHLVLEHNFGISLPASQAFLRLIDTNGDLEVGPKEIEAFTDRMEKQLLAKIELRVNGQPASFERFDVWQAGFRGRPWAKPCDIYYKFKVKLPAELPSGGWWVHFDDQNFADETATVLSWVPVYGHADGVSFAILNPEPTEEYGDFKLWGRKATLFFDHTPHPEVVPGEIEVPTPEELALLIADQPVPGKTEPAAVEGETPNPESQVVVNNAAATREPRDPQNPSAVPGKEEVKEVAPESSTEIENKSTATQPDPATQREPVTQREPATEPVTVTEPEPIDSIRWTTLLVIGLSLGVIILLGYGWHRRRKIQVSEP